MEREQDQVNSTETGRAVTSRGEVEVSVGKAPGGPQPRAGLGGDSRSIGYDNAAQCDSRSECVLAHGTKNGLRGK